MSITTLEFIKSEVYDKTSFVIWGTGRKAEELIQLCKNDITIKFCIERLENIDYKECVGIPVCSLSECKNKLQDKKIIIASQAYLQIKQELLEMGILEDAIFIYSEWELYFHWYKNRKIVVPAINIITGNICNLNCRGCIAYVPYSKVRKNISYDEMKETVDSFFATVDYVGEIYFGGGEVFTNRDIGKVMQYLFRKYGDRYGKVYIITNGTVVPDESILKACYENHIYISISDYSTKVKNGYQALEEKLIEYKIKYVIEEDFVRDEDKNVWFDLGNPLKNQGRTTEQLRKLFTDCVSTCRVIYDEKLWYCSSIAYGKLGLGLEPKESDYCDLNMINKENEEDIKKFFMTYLGMPLNGHYEMCKNCNGMGSYVNKSLIPAAEQIEHDIK